MSKTEEPTDPFAADHTRRCAVCGDSPVVAVTGLCGPCTFGGAEQSAAAWRPRLPAAAAEHPSGHPPGNPSLAPSAALPASPPMSREEALLRLGTELPEDAFASIHLSEVALANRDVAEDIRAGGAARVHREWSVLITAPGFQRNHAGDELGAVVEQALADYFDHRTARDAEEWARSAVPDRPPRLTAPTTAEEEQRRRDEKRGRGKGAG